MGKKLIPLLLSCFFLVFLWSLFLYEWAFFRDAIDYNDLYYSAQRLSIPDFFIDYLNHLGWFDPFYSLFIYIGSNIFGLFSINPFIFYSIVPAFLNIEVARRVFSSYGQRLFSFWPTVFLCSIGFYNLILAFELRRLALSLLILFLTYPNTNKVKTFGILLSLLIHPQVFVFSVPILFDKSSNYSFVIKKAFQLRSNIFVLLYSIVLTILFGYLLSTPFFALVYSKILFYSSSFSRFSLFGALVLIFLYLVFKGPKSYYASLVLLLISLLVFGKDRVNILIYYTPFLFANVLQSRVKFFGKSLILVLFLLLGLVKTFLDFRIDPCNMYYPNPICPLKLVS